MKLGVWITIPQSMSIKPVMIGVARSEAFFECPITIIALRRGRAREIALFGDREQGLKLADAFARLSKQSF